ncbi:MAG: slipin family protein [Thiotrichaceae bacterium]|nr:slipin family protein [Thiotrichaceae bacterium]
MFITEKLILSDTQRALFFKKKQFHRILGAGEHHFWGLSPIEAKVYDMTESVGIVIDKRLQQLMELYPEQFANDLQVVSSGKGEIALIYQNDKLVHIIPESSEFALWKALSKLKVIKQNVDEQPCLPSHVDQEIRTTHALHKVEQHTRTFTLAMDKRALLFCNDQLIQVLNHGHYRFWDQSKALTLEKIAIDDPLSIGTNSRLLQLVEQHMALFEDHVMHWTTADNEVGLVYENNVLRDILSPGQQGMYWKSKRLLEVRKLNIEDTAQLAIDKTLARQLRLPRESLLGSSVSDCVCHTEITENHVGFLWIDGKLEQMLTAGAYSWWKFNRNITIKHLDMRLQNMAVNGQEILTKDRVSLRINLSATWQVTDAETVERKLADHEDYLYRELQLALRAVVSTRSLDELLEDKNLLNKDVLDIVVDKVSDFGIELQSTGVKDIILPGEMKEILEQVVEAQKIAEANLIRRREETQATRSLHNTAKMMEGNPTLLRLKELEVLERVISDVNTLNVYGGIDGMMNDMVRLK